VPPLVRLRIWVYTTAFAFLFLFSKDAWSYENNQSNGLVIGALMGYQVGYMPFSEKVSTLRNSIFAAKNSQKCYVRGTSFGFSLGYDNFQPNGTFLGFEGIFNKSKAQGSVDYVLGKNDLALSQKMNLLNEKNFEVNCSVGYCLGSSFVPFLKLGYGLNQMRFFGQGFAKNGLWTLGSVKENKGFWMHSLVLGGGLNILLNKNFSIGLASSVHLSRNKSLKFLLNPNSSNALSSNLNIRNIALFNTVSLRYKLTKNQQHRSL
jgi:hypothetical protein